MHPRSIYVGTLMCLVILMACASQERASEGQRSTARTQRTDAVPEADAASTAPIPTTAAAIRGSRTLREEDLRGLPWRSVGPANMGGRVAAIAFAPGTTKTFYVGFGTGGLWKTTNAGTTFAPVFDDQATSSIGSVAVVDAPATWPGWSEDSATPQAEREKNGRAKIVWVGTGEGNGRNSSSWGRGMYRSTDGGGTFAHAGLADSHDIPSIAVDPRDPDVCFAAALGHLWGPNAERGVFKTTDGGKTWKAVLSIDADTGACDVVIDPKQPSTVYAAMYMRRRTAYSFASGGPNGGMYRSDDSGATWKKLAGGLPSQTGRIGIGLFAKDPRTLYAVVESDLGGRLGEPFEDESRAGGLFRSDDRGETWTRVHAYTPRAFYFSRVRVDPVNAERVYVLGWQVWISDDGGKTLRAGGSRKPHVDFHALEIDPADPDHIVSGSDGGIYVSHDGAQTWDFLSHLAVGQFYNVAADLSEPYRIAGGLQDNGSWMGPSATMFEVSNFDGTPSAGGILNQHWTSVYGSDGFHVAFDPGDRNVVYAESQGGGLVRIHLDTGVLRTIAPSPKEGERRFRFNWNTPFFVSPHVKPGEPTTLYMGGNSVFRLLDGGDRWEKISGDLTRAIVDRVDTVGSNAETHGTLVSLAESPRVKGVLWAGSDDGRVHVTVDGGGTWSDVTPPQTNGLYVARVEPSRHDAQVCYVAIDGHRSDVMTPNVVATRDGGKTWASITGDLPQDAPVLVVREDLRNPAVLYAGTETSAFVSIDAGARWVKLNGQSLPTVPVHDLFVHPREHDLIAGTHGRSIYVLDDAAPIGALTQAVLDAPLHLFDVPAAKPRLLLPLDGVWTERAFVAANPPMGARITYWLRDYTGDDVKIRVTDSRGKTVREITGTHRPGLNRAVWDLEREPYDRLPDPNSDLGQKQFVAPGEYDVSVSCGKLSARGKVTVLAGPGPAIRPRAGLHAATEQELR
ncbi:MAG: hypothetical protein ACKVWV_03935 [Planctomycetota bacterium]